MLVLAACTSDLQDARQYCNSVYHFDQIEPLDRDELVQQGKCLDEFVAKREEARRQAALILLFL